MTDEPNDHADETPPLSASDQAPAHGLITGHKFGQEQVKANRGRADDGEQGQKDPVASPAYRLSALDSREIEAIQLILELVRNHDLRFRHHLRAIAASADGLGLNEPDRITVVAQRDVDFTSLAVLANWMRVTPEDPLHAVSLAPETTGGNSPDQLAIWLSQEQEAGRLLGDIILLVLPSWALTPEWEGIANENLRTPLRQWLWQNRKRLIIGVEPPSSTGLSVLVRPEMAMLPLPWGVPFIARLAARGKFNPSRLDRGVIEDLDRESTWQSPLDDASERGRYLQILAFKTRHDGPEELSAGLRPLLNEKVTSLEEQWREGRALADSAMDIAPDAAPTGQGMPTAITRSLLCTVAFAPALPVGQFLAIVSASLPSERCVEFSDLTATERNDLLLLAGLQASEHKTLPPLPTIREYFEKNASRICRACKVEADDEGNVGLAGSWRSFPLAAHICQKAPSVAIDYADRLLTRANRAEALATGDINPMLRIMAHLLFSLPSGVSHQELAQWLLHCALRTVPEDERGLVLDEATQPANATWIVRQPSFATSISLAKCISQTTIAFLSEVRKVAACAGTRPQSTQDTTLVLHTLLSKIRYPQIAMATVLAMVLLDEEHRPGEHAVYERLLQEQLIEHDSMIPLVSRFFSTPIAGGAEGRCACACRLLAFLDKAAKREASHPIWKTARDKALSLILNEDIRWPPNDRNLLAYRFHRTSIAIELVSQIKHDLPVPSPLLEGRDIIMERFFARDPAVWLAESWQGWAIRDAPDRLYETVLILLDGPPAQARYWQTHSYKRVADRVLDSLMTNCRAEHLASLSDYIVQLQNCADYLKPPISGKPALRLYALSWPALLLFWRFRLFGVEQLPRDNPKVIQFKAFLERLCQTASPQVLTQIIEGLGLLRKALKNSLVDALCPHTDPVAHRFYSDKCEAAAKLASFLRNRLPPEQKATVALTTRSGRPVTTARSARP